ncbi:hypothetical protein BH11PAT4_BH11PAT4_1760 [soil metagenome]
MHSNLSARFSAKNIFAYALFAFVLTLGTIMYADLTKDPHLRSFGDALNYITMSEHPFAAVKNPFALRLLSPGVVHWLTINTPLGMNASWLLITLASSFAALVVFFKTLSQHFKLSYGTSVLATLFLAYSYNYIHFNLYDYWLVDPLNNLAYILAFWFLFKRQPIAFYITLLIGAVNKETAIFLIPLYPLSLIATGWGALKTREFWVSCVTGVVIALSYLLFREWVVSQIQLANPGANYSPLAGPGGTTTKENIAFSLSLNKNQYELYHVLDFLWLFGAYSAYLFVKAGKMSHPLVIATLYLIPVCLFGRLFATDVQRVFIMMAPLVIMLVAHYMDTFKTEEQRKWFIVFFVLYAASSMGWTDNNTKLITQLLVLGVFATRLNSDRSITIRA